MSDTNTQTQDATSQDKLAKKPEGSEATGTQHEPTAYMTKEKMESMVPWEFIPMQLPNYGWCQVKIVDYGQANCSGNQHGYGKEISHSQAR